MKETIYTIPINDAFSADCECPICEFMQAEESKAIDYALGASMMEPDARIASNENGYCQRHTQMMYDFGNKLSHALVLETRLDFLIENLDSYAKSLRSPKKNKFGTDKEKKLNCTQTCTICSKLERIQSDFVSNLFYMYKKDNSFREKFFSCKGFCLRHFEYLANTASKHLESKASVNFLNKLTELQRNNLVRVKEDVNWFTKKFDYRYRDEDWKNSKDAVIRASQKISCYIKEK